MKKNVIVLLLGLILLLSACTSSKDATRALDNAGYTHIKTGGYSWFVCSESDFYHTKFTAINPIGKTVSGVVCSGLFFKSATIRF